VLHGLRRADEAVGLLGHARELLAHPPLPELVEGALHGAEEFLVGEGFGQILFGALLDGFHRAFDTGVAGNHHHLGLAEILAHVADEIETAHTGHLVIGDHQIHRGRIQRHQRFGYAGGGVHAVTLTVQTSLQDFESVGRVIHHQDAFARDHAGLLTFLLPSRSHRSAAGGLQSAIPRPDWCAPEWCRRAT